MKDLLNEVRSRVLSPGAFAGWKHEASNQARPDLENLELSAQAVFQACRELPDYVGLGMREEARRAAFDIMQHLYPIVEALDTDAGQYLAQATEALRKVGTDL